MNDYLFPQMRTVVRGGGDLGSGVAFRLYRAGFPVLITELAQPLLVRRAVAYGSAVVESTITIEGITARRVSNIDTALSAQHDGEIAVLVDPDGDLLPAYNPAVLIDARMLKRPVTQPFDAALTIGLGPGFTAPDNCDIVIETNRGHRLGRAIAAGSAEPNTGVPGSMAGRTVSRVLRAPVDGAMQSRADIGQMVTEGDPVAAIGGENVQAPFDGVLRGLVHDGLTVTAGTKIGDVDPRANRDHCFTISDKALAIGGGVVEAIFAYPVTRTMLHNLCA